MEESCKNCKNLDEFGFCTKLVIDTRRCFVENDKYIKAYYINEREDDDVRISFMVPLDFKCMHYVKI